MERAGRRDTTYPSGAVDVDVGGAPALVQVADAAPEIEVLREEGGRGGGRVRCGEVRCGEGCERRRTVPEK